MALSNNQLVTVRIAPQGRLTIAEIETSLNQNTSYEEFLDYLGHRLPRLFEQFILVHDSGSLQPATKNQPRVILFADGLYLAFSEIPTPANRVVELIQFDPDKRRFSFHEISFGESLSINNSPETCAVCHGKDGRPIWNPYDFWPKIYGSHISRFGSEAEKAGYQKIEKAHHPSHSIMSRLKFPTIKSNYNEVAETFNQYAGTMGMMRMIKGWKSHREVLRPFLLAVAGILNHCAISDNVDTQIARLKKLFHPDHWDYLDQNLPAYYQETMEAHRQLKKNLSERYDHNFPNSPIIFDIDHNRLLHNVAVVSQLRLVMEGLGIFLQEDTLSSGENPYFMQVPSNFGAEALLGLFELDPQRMNEADPKFGKLSYHWASFSCQKLADKSAPHTRAGSLTRPKSYEYRGAAVMGRCISCHATEEAAIKIPFDRHHDLKTWLRRGGLAKAFDRLDRTGPGKMPPDTFLLPEDIDAMKQVLQRIHE